MIKLLRRISKKDALLALFCVALVLGQVYFDLKMPDFMSDLTLLINTPGTEMSAIIETGAKMLACTLISASLAILCGFLTARIASGFSYKLTEDMFSHVLSLGQGDMQKFSIPSLINRTTQDVTQVQMFISIGLQNIIKAPVMAIWAVVKILGKSWELSVITAGFAILMIGSSLLILASVLPRFKIVQKLIDKINRTARENLSGISVVHAFNAERYQNDKFEEVNEEMMQTQRKNQTRFAFFQPIMGIGMNGLALCIYWVGAALLNSVPLGMERMNFFGDVIVFSTYATFVVMSFMMLIMIFMMYPAAKVSAARINKILSSLPSINEGKTIDGKECGTVEFKNVSFRYPDSAENQLDNISFKVGRGETLAFIGATGSSKTTLISLIARFYDATEGEVLVDGVNVKEYSFEGLYNKLGYITQKAILFSGSVESNIDFGEAAAPFDGETVDDAISIAQAAEFVNKLPEGKKSHIAQGGKNVSGGQKQRLSIARALARKPEILVFDDSFSALDYKTDAKLRKTLNEKLTETTKIIVAQRISTIRHADRIIVLDRGEAVGAGTHDELMQNCSVYREIAYSQLSEKELTGEAM